MHKSLNDKWNVSNTNYYNNIQQMLHSMNDYTMLNAAYTIGRHIGRKLVGVLRCTISRVIWPLEFCMKSPWVFLLFNQFARGFERWNESAHVCIEMKINENISQIVYIEMIRIHILSNSGCKFELQLSKIYKTFWPTTKCNWNSGELNSNHRIRRIRKYSCKSNEY